MPLKCWFFSASAASSWTKPCPTRTWPASSSTHPLSTVSPCWNFQILAWAGLICSRLTLGRQHKQNNLAAWTRFVNKTYLVTWGIQKCKHATDTCEEVVHFCCLQGLSVSHSGQVNVFHSHVATLRSARWSSELRHWHTSLFLVEFSILCLGQSLTVEKHQAVW